MELSNQVGNRAALKEEVHYLRNKVAELEQYQSDINRIEERLRLAMQAAQMGIWDWNIITDQVEWSESLFDLFAITPDSFEGNFEAVLNSVHPADREEMRSIIQKLLDEKSEDYLQDFRVLLPDGTLRYMSGNGRIYYDSVGNPVRMLGTSKDITPRKQAEETLKFLLDAGMILASSLDYATTLRNLASIIVPRIADWCTIDMAEKVPNRELPVLKQLVLVHTDPAKEALVDELRIRLLPDLDETNPMVQTFLTGKSLLVPQIPLEMIEAVSPDEKTSQLLRELNLISALYVPIMAHGRSIGVITLNTSDSGRKLDESDVSLTEELARRAGLAIESARLFSAEQQARQAVENFASRTNRLQQVTLALAEALTPDEVTRAMVTQGVEVLGAYTGSVVVLVGDGHDRNGRLDPEAELELTGYAGYEDETISKYQRFPLSANWPAAEVIRTRQPVFIETEEELQRRYDLSEADVKVLNNSQAFAAVPLIAQNRVLGTIAFTFLEQRSFSAEDRLFLQTLASGCAQALERARLYSAEQASRQRLSFLAEASRILGESLDYEVTLQRVAQLLVPDLADWCSVHILNENSIPEQVALAHVDPAKIEWAKRFQAGVEERYPYNPDAPGGIPNVIRTGKPELYPEIPDEMLVAAAPDEELLEVLRSIGYSSVMIVPLVARGRVLGVLQLVATESGKHYTDADLELACELGGRAAGAVDNARLYRAAQEAIRARNEFLSVAAHELKTPVTSLKGHSQLVMRQINRFGQADPARVSRAMEVINQQSDKLAHLVDQLLDVSRLETGRMSLTLQPVNLTAILEEIVATARATMLTDKHNLEVEYRTHGPVTANIDAIRVEQVLTNLVGNAIKYSPNGGLVKVVLSKPENENVVEIAVSDQGLGVEPEYRDRLFERFYQAHAGNYTSGMGLGLYISRQIVQLHQGDIMAEFPEEGGSCFIVCLPTDLPLQSESYNQ
ncbi:MAG TPA: GAF domain-containing protein [Chloroflexia bacterium]|nr:GAF domain-containing protein [Chloroflexia bacterium]